MPDTYVVLGPDGKSRGLWTGAAAPTPADLGVLEKQVGGKPALFKWNGAKPPSADDLTHLTKSIADGSAAVAAAKAPAPAKPVTLGDPKKPASLKLPETAWHATKRTLYQSLPTVFGAAGGAVGLALGAPTAVVGPEGPATTMLIGSGSGAMLGRYAQSVIDHFTDGKKLPTLEETAKQSGQAATSQMYQDMAGQIIAVPFGTIRRGGFVKMTPEVANTVEANRRLGTQLSGPEIASGTRTGNIAKSVQAYAGGAFVGGEMQRELRQKGTIAATEALDRSLKILTAPSETRAGAVLDETGRNLGGYAGTERRAIPWSDPSEAAYEAARSGRPVEDVIAERKAAEVAAGQKGSPTGVERRGVRSASNDEAFKRGVTGQTAPSNAERAAGVNKAIQDARAEGRPGSTPPAERPAPSSARVEAGQAAKEGLGAAKAGLRATGKEMSAIIEAAPALEMAPIKDEAYKLFQDRIIPLLKDFPDVAGNPKVAAIIRELRSDPQMVQRMPRPAMTMLADAILEKTNSPVIKTLRAIMGAEDSVSFKAATQMRTMLRKAGAGDDGLLPKKDAAALARKFEGVFTDHLFRASPEFKAASQSYAEGANLLRTQQIEKIFKTAVSEPEAVVAYLKRDTPTRARLLRTALLTQAAKGPEAEQAKAAFDVIRATWFKDAVIGGDLEGMAARMKAAKDGGVLQELFGDEKGTRMLAGAQEVANLMAKRTPIMTGNLRKIFEIGRLVTAGIGAGSAVLAGKSPAVGAAGAALLWEGIPDFFIWAIHDPRATKWFVQGVRAEDPKVSSAAIIRLMELFRQTHEAGKKQRAKAPVPAGATP